MIVINGCHHEHRSGFQASLSTMQERLATLPALEVTHTSHARNRVWHVLGTESLVASSQLRADIYWMREWFLSTAFYSLSLYSVGSLDPGANYLDRCWHVRTTFMFCYSKSVLAESSKGGQLEQHRSPVVDVDTVTIFCFMACYIPRPNLRGWIILRSPSTSPAVFKRVILGHDTC